MRDMYNVFVHFCQNVGGTNPCFLCHPYIPQFTKLSPFFFFTAFTCIVCVKQGIFLGLT